MVFPVTSVLCWNAQQLLELVVSELWKRPVLPRAGRPAAPDRIQRLPDGTWEHRRPARLEIREKLLPILRGACRRIVVPGTWDRVFLLARARHLLTSRLVLRALPEAAGARSRVLRVEVAAIDLDRTVRVVPYLYSDWVVQLTVLAQGSSRFMRWTGCWMPSCSACCRRSSSSDWVACSSQVLRGSKVRDLGYTCSDVA